MNRFRKTILSVLLFALPLASFAQYCEYDRYMEEAGDKTIALRGKKAFNYNIYYNGHCYWETKDFKPGMIRYNEKTYTDLEINIDVCHNELLVRKPDGTIPIALDREAVSYLKIGDTEFILLEEGKYSRKLPPGFYEVVFAGDDYNVYRKVTKTLSPDTDGTGSIHIGYNDPDFNYSIHDFFCFKERFYLEKDGKMKKIGSGKAAKLSRMK